MLHKWFGNIQETTVASGDFFFLPWFCWSECGPSTNDTSICSFSTIQLCLCLQDAQNVRDVLNSNPAHLCVYRIEARSWSSPALPHLSLKKPSRLDPSPHNGFRFFLPSLRHFCARMCIDMVIIYKKTLEKGSDDVTYNATGLGPVSYLLLYTLI